MSLLGGLKVVMTDGELTLKDGDKVLVTNQTNPEMNGVRVVSARSDSPYPPYPESLNRHQRRAYEAKLRRKK